MLELRRTFRLLVLIHLGVSTCSAIGLSLGQCDDETFMCQCGPKEGPTVKVSVPSCTFFYKWKPYCHACKNGNRISPPDVCPKFQRCATCSYDGESCSTCPVGKFGTFCEKSQTVGGRSTGLLDLNLSLGLLPGLTGGGQKQDDKPSPPVPNCRCVNGGRCQGFDDFCTCPPGYQGLYCEKKTGCPRLQPTPPLSVTRIPEDHPQYMEYSCPRTGFLLEGSPRLNCLKDTNQWSHPPPICVPACSAPPPPVNGWLVNVSSPALIKSGNSVEFGCTEGLVLTGPSKTTCTADTTWSHEAPFCIEVSFCGEPQPVVQATYDLQVPPFQPPFSNGTRVEFTCTDNYLLMGPKQIVCKDGGQWSSPGPTCVKVFEKEVDCETIGSKVVDGLGTPVRVHCPANCADKNGTVWGTVIYEEASSVCRAAVHSGRVSDALGGSLFVVNNGPYNDFLASSMHGVASQRRRVLSKSFRFHHDPELEQQNRDDPDKGCPRGWTELSGHCIYVVAKSRAWDVAKGICTNMGSRLPSLRDPAFLKQVLMHAGPQSDVDSFWLLSKSNSNANGTAPSIPLLVPGGGGGVEVNPDILFEIDLDEDLDQQNLTECSVVNQLPGNPMWTTKSCFEESAFVCDIDLSQYLVTCEDRGKPENGYGNLHNPERGFRRGAVIDFKCKQLHVLRGEATSSCLPDGTWSTPLPRCQKIPACLNPPVVKFGSFQILAPLPPPTNSRIAGRPTGPGQRRSRIGPTPPAPPARLVRSAGAQEAKKAEEEELPPGHLRVGSRASYMCESRYYDLVGSQTRRCQVDGTWSGRPVTCLPVCGRSDSPRTPFITNGNSSDVGQWPWQVGIAHNIAGSDIHYLLCGGALLNEYWVVTAAHCVVDEQTGVPLEPQQIRLYAGKYHRDDSKDDDFVQIRQGIEVHIHPDYDPSLYDADIALIRMDYHVTLTSRVQPVCLPTDKSTRINLVDGKKGVVIGWGLTESSEYAETLRHAVLPVVSHERCEEGYQEAGMPLTVSENMFCAGLEEGQTDACSGDSGGPMVFQIDSGSRKYWVLEGVVSWGSLTGCGNRRQYGGFTKVNQFLDWINEYV